MCVYLCRWGGSIEPSGVLFHSLTHRGGKDLHTSFTLIQINHRGSDDADLARCALICDLALEVAGHAKYDKSDSRYRALPLGVGIVMLEDTPLGFKASFLSLVRIMKQV